MKKTSRATPRLASFFSGIGGFDLGFERAGFSISMQCEVDKYCGSILEKAWPNVSPRFTDIKGISNGTAIPLSEVWAGGFPCQDVSLARMGPRAGLKGSRSGLFHEFARLLGERTPPVFVIENVPGLLSSHGGRDFGLVIRTLAGFGYGVGWRMLNSKYFGVPQSRQRLFIVGTYRDWKGPLEILFESERSQGNAEASKPNGETSISPFKESLGDPVKGPVVQRLAYCLYACSARHTGTDWSRTYVVYPKGRVRRLTAGECEAIQGFPSGWTVPTGAEPDNDELDSLRYHALGNAVTVPLVEWLARRISKYLSSKTATDRKTNPLHVGTRSNGRADLAAAVR